MSAGRVAAMRAAMDTASGPLTRTTPIPLSPGDVAMATTAASVKLRHPAGRKNSGNALVAVNTSTDFVNVSGNLVVVDIATRTIVETIALGGQPDAIAVSPDGAYAAVAIENERDEDLGDGAPPQAPAGASVWPSCRKASTYSVA